MWGNLNQGIQSRHQGTSAAASPSPLGYSVFGSILTIGGVIGELVNTMWLSETFSTAGWLRIAFAKNAWWLDFGRLFSGFGIGLSRINYGTLVCRLKLINKRTFTLLCNILEEKFLYISRSS
ncbi:sugar transporter ERD6-like isoform X1 [Malus sylvestris]|uniref:sugar transporter ERD6-like isoform X1 n=1 Tax=Malus sylvestris TaxID=3752 RepID=UPI0021ABF22C|nr:sugar transporter ERD6-like isoform X1 [Malus sylvestris]XP_050114217.1 sugar transporter ERD6-like isoform X1 [Malus sylvestris]XP_050114218.1 sugar transporter ERD6-like isoform X1 [Malus sylvestris]XP_050114219.1 sugar transporter ERD6-like isoform X1 [Malus sylvestris]